MLVFGTYAFPIQTLDPERYGLPNGVQLQLYCKIGHLFWIPVFPIERIWVVKINGEKYEPSPEIRRAIEANEVKKSNPFYAFALPLLLAIGIPSFNFYEGYQREQSQIRYEARELERKQGILGQIDFPEQGDLFYFQRHTPGDPTYRYTRSLAAVEAVTSDSLLLRVPYTDENLMEYAADKYLLDVNKPVYYTWVSKKDFKATISLETNDYDEFSGREVKDLFSGQEIQVTKTKKGDINAWEAMVHPEPPFTRFRNQSK